MSVFNLTYANEKNLSKEELIINFLNNFEPYYISALVVVGLIGNTISFLLFVFTKLRSEQANPFLISLAVADNGFLVSLIIVTFRHLNFDLLDRSEVVCKLNVFLGYVFSFLSNWFVAAFSVERFIAVYFPLKRLFLINKHRSSCCILALVFISFLIYTYSLFTSGIEDFCVTLEKWFSLTKLFAMLDILLSIIIPFFVIAITNFLIVLKLMSFRSPFSKSVHKMSVASSKDYDILYHTEPKRKSSCQRSSSIVIYKNNGNLKSSRASSMLRASAKTKRTAVYSKTTRMLITISTTFLILQAPIAYSKTTYFWKAASDGMRVALEEKSSPILTSANNKHKMIDTMPFEEIIERITCYAYYLNFSLNFFLYALNGSRFRQTLWRKITFCKK